jgi:rhamnogalacturonyl hydrolase YesR
MGFEDMSVFKEMKASTERMIAELESAGYERYAELFEKRLTLKHPYEPDMMLWNDGLFFHSVSQAYEHLQEKRQFEAMKALIERVATTDFTEIIEHQADGTDRFPRLDEAVKEAKRLIED